RMGLGESFALASIREARLKWMFGPDAKRVRRQRRLPFGSAPAIASRPEEPDGRRYLLRGIVAVERRADRVACRRHLDCRLPSATATQRRHISSATAARSRSTAAATQGPKIN